MRAGVLSWCLVLAIVPLAHARASAPDADRQSVRSKLTTKRPGAPTGTSMWMRFRDPATKHGKPHSVDKVVIRVPRGMRFDNSALPQCTASDAELIARGEAACPDGSNVQRGELVLDTGSPLVVPRLMPFRTATFNSDGGLVSIGEAEDFPFRGVVRSTIRGRTVTVDYVDAPGFGGPDSQSAMKTMFTSGPALARGGRSFLRSPPRCPRKRRWTTRYTFIYHDGLRQTERTRAPCRPRRRRAVESPAGGGTHATVENRWTTTRPNTPTGFRFTGRYHAAGDPDGDPPYMRRMVFYLPRGMRYDTTVPDRCTASDLELKVAGASACPAGSRLGTGTVDTKFMGFPSTLDIDVLNNTNEMIMLAHSPGLNSVTRGKINTDGSVEFSGPTCFPSFDPPGCPVDTALQLGSSITVAPYVRSAGRRVRSYATTPRKCPKSGRWRTRVRFWWADGNGETLTTKHRCRRRAGRRAK